MTRIKHFLVSLTKRNVSNCSLHAAGAGRATPATTSTPTVATSTAKKTRRMTKAMTVVLANMVVGLLKMVIIIPGGTVGSLKDVWILIWLLIDVPTRFIQLIQMLCTSSAHHSFIIDLVSWLNNNSSNAIKKDSVDGVLDQCGIIDDMILPPIINRLKNKSTKYLIDYRPRKVLDVHVANDKFSY